MVKLSVSKVARMLGVTRGEIQAQINNGTLQTHEGYVTTDSVRLAYPEFNLCSEQDNHIKKILEIKDYAAKKMHEQQSMCSENEKKLLKCIEDLKQEIKHLQAKIALLEQN